MSRRTLLSPEQRARLFAVPTTPAEMARHYVLSAEDLVLVRPSAAPSIGWASPYSSACCGIPARGPGEQPPAALLALWRNSSAHRPRRSPTMRGATRPDTYLLLKPLIGDAVDTAALVRGWAELMRVKASIEAGAVASSTVLRKIAAPVRTTRCRERYGRWDASNGPCSPYSGCPTRHSPSAAMPG